MNTCSSLLPAGLLLIGCISACVPTTQDAAAHAGTNTEGQHKAGRQAAPASASTRRRPAAARIKAAGKSETAKKAPVLSTSKPAVPAALLAAHNQWRAKVGVPALQWSVKLADLAQQWANHLAAANCSSRHSNQREYGENIFAASPVTWSTGKTEMQQVTPQHVVADWGNESKSYDYASNSCAAVCGHYTQLVWKDSKEVGCGMAVCRDKAQIWVCKYYPAGNMNGKRPY